MTFTIILLLIENVEREFSVDLNQMHMHACTFNVAMNQTESMTN